MNEENNILEEEVQHSPKFDKVKKYFDKGLWPEIRIRNAVEKNWITTEEFTEITGLDYWSKE